MKNITIKQNPFVGFEEFALTTEEARMVKGGDQGVSSELTSGAGGGGSNPNCAVYCTPSQHKYTCTQGDVDAINREERAGNFCSIYYW